MDKSEYELVRAMQVNVVWFCLCALCVRVCLRVLQRFDVYCE